MGLVVKSCHSGSRWFLFSFGSATQVQHFSWAGLRRRRSPHASVIQKGLGFRVQGLWVKGSRFRAFGFISFRVYIRIFCKIESKLTGSQSPGSGFCLLVGPGSLHNNPKPAEDTYISRERSQSCCMGFWGFRV